MTLRCGRTHGQTDEDHNYIHFCAFGAGIDIDVSRKIQSTLVISKSKGFSEILRDQINTFHKRICNLTPENLSILKILWKRGEISPLFHIILLPIVILLLKQGPDFHFEIGGNSK